MEFDEKYSHFSFTKKLDRTSKYALTFLFGKMPIFFVSVLISIAKCELMVIRNTHFVCVTF